MPILSDITLTGTLAVWGAFVATLVLLWDIYKWRTSGAQIIFRATPNMKITEDVGNCTKDQTYVHVEAINKGDSPTTLTKLTASYYKNHLNRIRRKSETQYYIKTGGDKLPYLLEPGKIWNGIADQAELERLPKTGILTFAIYLSHRKRPQKVRVHLTTK